MISEEGVRGQLLSALKFLRQYWPYLVAPVGIFALGRLFSRLVPGPHFLPKLSLRNRTVMITGASSGLGKELALKFYREGAKLILVARSTVELEKLCNSLKTMGDVRNPNEPVYLYLDLANVNEQLIDRIISHLPDGKLDVLVNNAGLSMRGSCEDTSMDVQKKVMEINYFGHLHLTTALLSRISEDGAIVVTNSIQGKLAVPYRSAYSASKHATLGFFDSLRAEKGPYFHILSVFAGYINTGFGSRALDLHGRPVEVEDPDQAKGMNPAFVANQVYSALVNRQTELTLAPFFHRLAIFLRWLWPDLLFYLVYRRSLKDPLSKKAN